MANYLPGLFASPHPIPQETTPKESATSFTMQEIDPPESPLKKFRSSIRSRSYLKFSRNAHDREDHDPKFV